MDLLHNWLTAISWSEHDLSSAWLVDDVVLAPVLISVSVPTNNDWLSPAWHESRDVGDDDGLSEDGSIEDVPDGAVGTLPHLLQTELLHSSLIWSDSGALNADLALLNGLGSIDGDLIIGGVSTLHGQVVVLGINIYVRENVLNESKD